MIKVKMEIAGNRLDPATPDWDEGQPPDGDSNDLVQGSESHWREDRPTDSPDRQWSQENTPREGIVDTSGATEVSQNEPDDESTDSESTREPDIEPTTDETPSPKREDFWEKTTEQAYIACAVSTAAFLIALLLVYIRSASLFAGIAGIIGITVGCVGLLFLMISFIKDRL